MKHFPKKYTEYVPLTCFSSMAIKLYMLIHAALRNHIMNHSYHYHTAMSFHCHHFMMWHNQQAKLIKSRPPSQKCCKSKPQSGYTSSDLLFALVRFLSDSHLGELCQTVQQEAGTPSGSYSLKIHTKGVVSMV